MPNLGKRQSKFLSELKAQGGIDSFPIARHLSLLQRGLIAYEKTGPGHIVRYTITDEGEKMLKRYPHNQEGQGDAD